MRTHEEDLANAKILAERLAAAAANAPMNELFMAIMMIIAYSLKKETRSLDESRRVLEKFRTSIDESLKELWEQ